MTKTIAHPPNVLGLLRRAADHCEAARVATTTYERVRRAERASLDVLQALAIINGPCGVRPPVAPTADRPAVLPPLAFEVRS